jgi:hypothetical protein
MSWASHRVGIDFTNERFERCAVRVCAGDGGPRLLAKLDREADGVCWNTVRSSPTDSISPLSVTAFRSSKSVQFQVDCMLCLAFLLGNK